MEKIIVEEKMRQVLKLAEKGMQQGGDTYCCHYFSW
ncbi:hypothetical protein Clopa_1928 [Clostridium pasteurianum BC1]|uniref:Uncharacterized protein n=1 Tax=Clostridium pasteurianum BC1 TaxID=86416 RepID=R4K156_CLOPA|nr:hypothetical protein Clopa_1928 [Clostridium pasteurianum BC1]